MSLLALYFDFSHFNITAHTILGHFHCQSTALTTDRVHKHHSAESSVLDVDGKETVCPQILPVMMMMEIL